MWGSILGLKLLECYSIDVIWPASFYDEGLGIKEPQQEFHWDNFIRTWVFEWGLFASRRL